MIRSNSKKATNNLKAYIVENYQPEGYDNAPAEDAAFEKIGAFIYDTFMSEVGQHRVRMGDSFQEAFEYWAAGLPSILDTCYYYNRSAVADLGAILEETEAEKARFSEWEAEAKLTYLIFREIKNAKIAGAA